LVPFRRGNRGEVIGGDVITAINDEPVADLDDMLSVLEKRSPGDTVTLSLWRGGQTRKQSVVLAAGD
jgi:S1-C subfamily serine protease